MPLPQRMFSGDEELGKKDDEYKPGQRSMVWHQRRASHGLPRSRRSLKRIALGVLAVIALYYFVTNIPKDGKPMNNRPQFGEGGHLKTTPVVQEKKKVPKPTHKEVERNFNGPIKFFDLASTLHSAARLLGASVYNQNVVCVF